MAERRPTKRAAAAAAERTFDACFERLLLADRKAVVVAVSGGSDSTALLHLFTNFVRRRHPNLKVRALTVDHGLRPQSAGEAVRVGEWARRLGVGHTIKRWQGDKPATGLMDAARDARHRLLAEAALEAGTDLVLVAHTLDDQAETVAMRRSRGAGRGSAGIAEATLHDWRVWFARPLIGVRRAALRDVLSEAGQDWIDDPSNEDMRYERVRVRSALGGDDHAIAGLAAEARLAAAQRRALERRAADLVNRYASAPVQGLLRLEPAFSTETDREAAVYALRILLAVAGGQTHLPDEARAAKLMDRLAEPPFRATMSRAVIDARASGIFLHRERRNLPAIATFAPGIWDGRFRLLGADGNRLRAGVPDRAAVDALMESAAGQATAPASLVRAALSTLPALWRDGRCLGLASEARDITCEPALGPWARYLPAFDLQPAGAAARLIGAPAPPASPFAGHKEAEA